MKSSTRIRRFIHPLEHHEASYICGTAYHEKSPFIWLTINVQRIVGDLGNDLSNSHDWVDIFRKR